MWAQLWETRLDKHLVFGSNANHSIGVVKKRYKNVSPIVSHLLDGCMDEWMGAFNVTFTLVSVL